MLIGIELRIGAMLSAAGIATPDGAVPAGIEFSAGQLTVKGLRLTQPQMELASGKLAALGYTARAEGERLTLRTGGQP